LFEFVKICRGLEDGEPSLKLTLSERQCELVYYHQANVTATRKVILPMLKDILKKEPKLSRSIPLIPTIVVIAPSDHYYHLFPFFVLFVFVVFFKFIV